MLVRSCPLPIPFFFFLHKYCYFSPPKVQSFFVICKAAQRIRIMKPLFGSSDFSLLFDICSSYFVWLWFIDVIHLWQWHRLLLWAWVITMNMRWRLKLRRYIFNCALFCTYDELILFDSYLVKKKNLNLLVII